MFVGRSKNIAQRIGSDLRSKDKNAANVTYRLLNDKAYKFNDMEDARDYFYRTYTVTFIEVEDVHVRTLLQLYISMELKTKYNTYIEH